jgi:hypothetical protein
VSVSDIYGSDISSWVNPTAAAGVVASIPNGFYANHNVMFSEPNLVAANIKSGVSIFGVTGNASGVLGLCATNGLQSTSCSVAANTYWTNQLGANITATDGALTSAIAAGYYDGTKSVTMSDSNLLAANILSGATIFGVTGSAIAAYAACADGGLNNSQCSTAANRYVYSTANGGRSLDCSAGANASACWTNSTNQYVTGTLGTNVSSWSNSGTTTVSGAIAAGYYSGNTISFDDPDLVASNIGMGVNIFGVVGTFKGLFAPNMNSTALRDAGVVVIPNLLGQTTSTAMTISDETTTYAGVDLPSTGGTLYRDIPDVTKDDEGYQGTTCKYAPRPTVNCGETQDTILARIADCLTANPSSATWNGATQCSRGQGTWKLVTRKASNKEVWQDQRTGLLWSSLVSTGMDWCKASGNTQMAPVVFINSYNTTVGTAITGNGSVSELTGGTTSYDETITLHFTSATTGTVSSAAGATNGCQGATVTSGGLTGSSGSWAVFSKAGKCSFKITQGATAFATGDKFTLNATRASLYSCVPGATSALQPASPISYCAEAAGLNPPGGETWTSGGYVDAKGVMGRVSTPGASPSVSWRLPTIEDYKLADVNGIRMVMPDMGIAGPSRPVAPDASTGYVNDEWSASVYSISRAYAWGFRGSGGLVTYYYRNFPYGVRCVGR